MKDLFDIHTHTIISGHAYNTLYEMAKAAADRGLKLFGSSDHAPALPGSCHKLYFSNFSVIPRELFGVKVMMGSELNILDYEGKVDLSEKLLKKLDYGIASIHDLCYPIGSPEENTAAVLGAMANPYIQIIGHPDNEKIPLIYEDVVRKAKENHVLLEVNNSSLRPSSPRAGARTNYLRMLKLCKEYKVCVIVNSDAHCAADAGEHGLALKLLEEMDFPEELVVNRSLEALAEYIPCVQNFLD